jgi:hypothetical protein
MPTNPIQGHSNSAGADRLTKAAAKKLTKDLLRLDVEPASEYQYRLGRLLELAVLAEPDMLAFVLKGKEMWSRALTQQMLDSPSASSVLWRALAEGPAGNIDALIDTPRVLQDAKVRASLMARAEHLPPKPRKRFVIQMAMRVPAQNQDEILRVVASLDPDWIVSFVEKTPMDDRASLNPDLLLDVMATSSDGHLRSRAILARGTLGPQETVPLARAKLSVPSF